MKSSKKPKRAILAKKSPIKKMSAKRVSVKKATKRKKVKIDKKLGVYVLVAGILGLIALFSLGISKLYIASTSDSDVMGTSTGLNAPTEFSATVDKYSAKLSWKHNAPSDDYKYMVFFYDKTLKIYMPADIVVDVNETGPFAYHVKYGYTTFDGTTVTTKVDQTPGETVIYRVALCEGECRVSRQLTDGKLTGWTAVDTFSSLSDAAVLTMPIIATPTNLTASSNTSGNRLSWKSIPGVDGYNIYRSTSYFGLTGYVKIGAVGTDGTFSTHHTFNADGTIGIPANVPSPTTFTDKATAPGVRYHYKIVARKMMAPPSYTKGWLYSYSAKSSSVKIVTARPSVPTVFNVASRVSNMALITTNYAETSSTEGYYLYCDLCTEKKMELKQGPNIGFAGVNDQDNTMMFGLSGLTPDTRYAFQLTRFRIYGGKTYESAKTSIKYVTTPSDGI